MELCNCSARLAAHVRLGLLRGAPQAVPHCLQPISPPLSAQAPLACCPAATWAQPALLLANAVCSIPLPSHLQVQHELTCTRCGHASSLVEQYMHLSLELPEAQVGCSLAAPLHVTLGCPAVQCPL